MVKAGGFTLELVDAETRVPFKEHVSPSDGMTYVETEPDVNYFVRVASDSDVAIKVKVDGVDLGCLARLSRPTWTNLGLLKVRDGRQTVSALKFVRTSLRPPGQAATTSNPAAWTGRIEASFFEAVVVTGERYGVRDGESSWHPGEVGFANETDLEHTKGVKTKKGDVEESIPGAIGECDWKKGRKLGSITVKYCTALGLIYAGTLPKPPKWNFWEEQRLRFPRKRGQEPEDAPIVTPKKIRIETTRQDDGIVLESKEVELFDFTDLPDSDDESPLAR